jgi:transcriptional regulator with XRE-family HTH domain
MARDEAQLLAMGLRIKELRLSRGYKQQWIADKIGVTLRTYQFWQQGKIPPTGENLERLAKLFGVTPTYILRGETPDPFGSASQLDRIEAKLNEVIERLVVAEVMAAVAAEEARAPQAGHAKRPPRAA